MYTLITTPNCMKCAAVKKLLKQTSIEYKELMLNESNTAEVISKLRASGIFKQEMPILVKDIDDDWEEVTCM